MLLQRMVRRSNALRSRFHIVACAVEGSSETRWCRSQCCAMLQGRAHVAPESAEHLLQ